RRPLAEVICGRLRREIALALTPPPCADSSRAPHRRKDGACSLRSGRVQLSPCDRRLSTPWVTTAHAHSKSGRLRPNTPRRREAFRCRKLRCTSAPPTSLGFAQASWKLSTVHDDAIRVPPPFGATTVPSSRITFRE